MLLGQPGKRRYASWKAHPERVSLKRDTLERISYLLGIYKALQVLLPHADAADAWVRLAQTQSDLGAATPLERMLAGNIGDLYVVRCHLDSRRGASN